MARGDFVKTVRIWTDSQGNERRNRGPMKAEEKAAKARGQWRKEGDAPTTPQVKAEPKKEAPKKEVVWVAPKIIDHQQFVKKMQDVLVTMRELAEMTDIEVEGKVISDFAACMEKQILTRHRIIVNKLPV